MRLAQAEVAAAVVAEPALVRVRAVADQRLHVLVTPDEMAYLEDLSRRMAGRLGRTIRGSASLGQVVRYLIHVHQEMERDQGQ